MRLQPRSVGATLLEIVGAIAAATLLVAALEGAATVGDLRAVYLLAVLFVAVRRGGTAAVITAIGSVLALNFFFVTPRHRLEISHSRDAAALVVFLVAALVVGRLAAEARARAAEAENRARLATVREREAVLVAKVAAAVLAGARIEAELPRLASEGEIRVSMSAVPSHSRDEHAVRLPTGEGSGWLYVRKGVGWEREDAERLAEALGKLVHVALERERVATRAAEAEATRRTEVAKTAVLHAVSHDFRSPLTAITTAAGGLREGALSDADREDLLSVIEDESQRLARMVGDLLDLSRIEAGAVHPQHRLVRPARRGVGRRRARARRSRRRAPVLIELPDDLPLVQADAAQLERVFANLIDNAMNHSPDGVPVRISGGAGRRPRDRPRDRPRPRHPGRPARARVRALLPRPRRRPRLRPRAWRSAAASSRPTTAASS